MLGGLDRRTVLVALLLLLLLADAVAGSVLALQRRDRQQALDEGLRPASAAVTQLLKAYVDQETGLRGYVITGREPFLEPYERGREEARSRSTRLRELLQREPALLARLDEVLERGEQWRQAAAEPEIDARRRGDRAAAERVVLSGAGKLRFDRVRAAAAELQSAVDARAEAVNRRSLRTADIANAVVMGSAVLALLLAAVLSTSVQRRVLQPVRRLRRSVERAADEPATTTVTVPQRADSDVAAVGRSAERLRERAVTSDRTASRAQEALAQEAPTVQAVVEELTPSGVPLPGGLVAAGTTEPADGLVAGDAHEIVALGADRVAVLVADASGHGPDAALAAVKARHSVLGALREHLEPGAALARLAVDLGETVETFVTLFVAVVDLPSAAVRYASAGHPSAVVLVPDGSVQALEATGPLLGPVRGSWQTRGATLSPGALLAVWTDGIPDARRVQHPRGSADADAAGASDRYGSSRLRTLLQEALTRSASDEAGLDVAGLVRRALADATPDQAPAGSGDDRTLVLVHRPARASGRPWHELPAVPSSASAARRLLRAAVESAEGRCTREVLEAAELCLTELVTNALLHADGRDLAVSVTVGERALSLAVRDGSSVQPRLQAHTAAAGTGRGMGLVDRLSARWGSEPGVRGGKVVWCDVDQASATRHTSSPDLDLDVDLERWVDLEPEAEPPGAHAVRLLRYPVRLGQRAREQAAAAVRDAQLQAMSTGAVPDPGTTARARLLHLVHGIATDDADPRGHAPAGTARDPRGAAPAVDVTVALDEPLLLEHSGVLDAVPAEPADATAAGPQASSEAVLDVWVLVELRRQLRGAEARPWPGPLG